MTETPSRLIELAFDLARESGKQNWHRMTLPVLKNRILHLTDRSFREAEFGVRNFRDFVRLAEDKITLDDSVFPAEAVFRGIGSEETVPTQIRADLWQAVMDYSRGIKFVWDAAQGMAREASDTDADTLPVLPTISEPELAEWRRVFVEQHLAGLDSQHVDRLEKWRDKALPSKSLPPSLVTEWNHALKSHAYEKLHSWFSEVGIPEPLDLLKPKRVAKPDTKRSDLQSLRELVINCVNVMNSEELLELRLSPAVILRTLRRS